MIGWTQPYTLQDAATATGNGVQQAINNYGAVSLQITGTFVGTVTWEISNDGSNWVGVPALNKTTEVAALTATAPGIYEIALGGVTFIRARISAYTSGTITVTGRSWPIAAPSQPSLASPLPTGAATSAKQDTQITAEQAILAKIIAAPATEAKQDTGNTSLATLVAQTDSLEALLGGTGSLKDNGAAWTSVFGVSGAAVVSADMTAAAAVTDAPTSGQKIVLTDIVISSDTAMNVLIEEETSGTDLFKVFVPANGTVQITPRSKMKLATVNKKVTAKASVAGNIAVTAFYFSEA